MVRVRRESLHERYPVVAYFRARDAHIPLVLMGARIAAGEYSTEAALNDPAPTIATLIGVDIPAGSTDRVLSEALSPARARTF
jgi:hypothetical protein